MIPAEYGCTSTGTRTRWPASPIVRCSTVAGTGTTGPARSPGGGRWTTSTRACGRTSFHQPTAATRLSKRPTALTIACVIRPPNIIVTPRAATMGHTVGAGCSMVSGSRFFGPGAVFMSLLPVSSTDDVDHCQHHDPYAIDEMPVPGDQLRVLSMRWPQGA